MPVKPLETDANWLGESASHLQDPVQTDRIQRYPSGSLVATHQWSVDPQVRRGPAGAATMQPPTNSTPPQRLPALASADVMAG